MAVVFDEKVLWPLRKFFSGHHVATVRREGCSGMENGELLERLDGSYDVFILGDMNLSSSSN